MSNNDEIDDTEHFLMVYPSFDILRPDFLAGVSDLLGPFAQINTLSNNALIQLFLYFSKDLPDDNDKNMIKLTLRFILPTGRFG